MSHTGRANLAGGALGGGANSSRSSALALPDALIGGEEGIELLDATGGLGAGAT